MRQYIFILHLFIGYLICLLFPFYQKLIPLLIVLWAFTFLLIGIRKDFFLKIYNNKTALFILLFFLIHVISLLYTENLASGKFDIESKLSLLVFPIIMSNSICFYNKKVIDKFFLLFIVGNLFASLYCLFNAFYKWAYLDASFQYFTYVDLSHFMHPTYFSMYLSTTLLGCFYLLSKHKLLFNLRSVFYIFSILLFTVMIYLLSSKAGLIVLCLLIFYFAKFYFKNLKKLILMAIVLLLIFSGIVASNDRFSSIKNSVLNTVQNKTTKSDNYSSSEQRIHVWKSTLELLKDNWLIGISAGDLKYKLTENHYSKKADPEKEKYLNAHNQYLESFLSVGILGIILLLSWMIYPVLYLDYTYRFIIVGLLIIISINFVFESILNRQEGITFISFFWLLFASKNQVLKNKIK